MVALQHGAPVRALSVCGERDPVHPVTYGDYPPPAEGRNSRFEQPSAGGGSSQAGEGSPSPGEGSTSGDSRALSSRLLRWPRRRRTRVSLCAFRLAKRVLYVRLCVLVHDARCCCARTARRSGVRACSHTSLCGRDDNKETTETLAGAEQCSCGQLASPTTHATHEGLCTA